MKPQARTKALIDILAHTESAPVPMDSVVGDYMRRRRYVTPKDRAYIAAGIYDIMRARARIGWWLVRAGGPDTYRAAVIALLALIERQDARRIEGLFDGSKYAPHALSEEERALLSKLEGQAPNHPDMPESVRVECPPLYEDALRSVFGGDFAVEMAAMIPPAMLDLRVNVFLKSREEVRESLEKDGVETDLTPYSPWGLRCRDKAYLAKTKAFTRGWVDIQDEGSQLIAHLCGARPGMQVLDYCAGAGGKTLALAAAMERKGRIVAMDIDERRLEKGRGRFKKAQLSDMIEVRPLSENRHRKWLRRQKGTFDVVLADVPCTGTGTWRRNPDMRWRTYGPEIAELLAVQAEILEKIAGTVKPGGRLVYATCSLLKEENEAQVAAFLKAHEDFEVVPHAVIPNAISSLSSRTPSHSVIPSDPGLDPGDEGSHNNQGDSSHALGMTDQYPHMRFTPHRHNTDGFFCAVLTRKK